MSPPFLTRDKSRVIKRRVIADLSWPLGHSVNSNVIQDHCPGIEFALAFPSIDTITRAVCNFSNHSHITKIHISRGFKHLSISKGYFLCRAVLEEVFI